MFGVKRSGRPTSKGQDFYAERANASLAVYNAELVPPATSYATVKSGLSTHQYRTPTIAPKVRAAYVDRHLNRKGLVYAWSWGGVNMGAQTSSLPFGGGNDGTVRSTMFQTALVQLHDWSQYLNIRQAGWNATGSGMFAGSKPVRYQYHSFRTPQPEVRTSGGPGGIGVRMQPRNRYSAVQRIQKSTTSIRYYNTRSAPGPMRSPGGASNVNRQGNA